MPNPPRVLLLSTALLVAGAGLSACGSDDDGGGSAGTTAAAQFDQAAYCAAAEQVDVLDDALDNAESPTEIEAGFRTTLDAFRAAGALAPGELEADYGRASDAYDDLVAILEENDWVAEDAATDEDFVKIVENEATSASFDAIDAYDETTCGLPGD